MWNIKKLIHKGDYDYALVPDHPNATKNGYVFYHRIVMENHLGRLLDKSEVVHHVNKNKHDNRIENLQLLNSKEHVRLYGIQQEGLTHEMERAISENIQETYIRYLDNSEGTLNQRDSVETIRTSSEMMKK